MPLHIWCALVQAEPLWSSKGQALWCLLRPDPTVLLDSAWIAGRIQFGKERTQCFYQDLPRTPKTKIVMPILITGYFSALFFVSRFIFWMFAICHQLPKGSDSSPFPWSLRRQILGTRRWCMLDPEKPQGFVVCWVNRLFIAARFESWGGGKDLQHSRPLHLLNSNSSELSASQKPQRLSLKASFPEFLSNRDLKIRCGFLLQTFAP